MRFIIALPILVSAILGKTHRTCRPRNRPANNSDVEINNTKINPGKNGDPKLINTRTSHAEMNNSTNSSDKIRGVNLGGWLVLEPWITPSLFDSFKGQQNAPKDEYMLSERLGKENAKRILEEHRKTFVTKKDLIKLKSAGINHIRIPVGYWAIDIKPNEPWIGGSLEYLINGVKWAGEVGLKVMIDIHGAPGSQNGFDNSGQAGPIRFLEKPNLDRLVSVLAKLTKQFSDAQYKNIVTSIELVNEPQGYLTDINGIKSYYNRGINTVREINKDITIAVHDAFHPLKTWEYLKKDTSLSSNDNLLYDIHRYQVFDDYFYRIDKKAHLNHSCIYLDEISRGNSIYPVVVGEWSLATTDCTKYLNGFEVGTRYEGTLNTTKLKPSEVKPKGSCSKYDNLNKFTDEHKSFLKQYFRQQVGVFEQAGSGWFFWNFKAENSPEWNFLMGVEEGWIDLSGPITPQC